MSNSAKAAANRQQPKQWKRDFVKAMNQPAVVKMVERNSKARQLRSATGEGTRCPDNPCPPLISAAAEIRVQPTPKAGGADDDFARLLDICDQVADGRCVFGEAHDPIRRALAVAFPLYRAIKADAAAHSLLIAHQKAKRGGQRGGSPRKPALNAVMAACHPQHPDERKLCSDWAIVIVLADLCHVGVAQFAMWVSGRGIADSKRKVREIKSGDKPPKRFGTTFRLPFRQSEYPCAAQAIAREDPCVLRPLREALESVETLLRRLSGGHRQVQTGMQLSLPFADTENH